MNNFDLRKFLAENKLTSNTSLLREEDGSKSFDGQEGSFLGKVGNSNVYSLEGSSVNDAMMYAVVRTVSIDVAGEEVSLDQIKAHGVSDEVAQFILDDINSEL